MHKLVHKKHILYSVKCSCYIHALYCAHIGKLRWFKKYQVEELRTSFLWFLTHKQTTFSLCSAVWIGLQNFVTMKNYIFSTGNINSCTIRLYCITVLLSLLQALLYYCHLLYYLQMSLFFFYSFFIVLYQFLRNET